MSAWIGPLGSLIEFKCPSAVESMSEDAHVYFRPLGGNLSVTRLGDGVRPRVWNVSVSAARPDQVATLQSLSEGQFGPGPFVFIPPAAPALNLLGKRDALAMGAPATGYMNDAPGSSVQTTEGLAGTRYGAIGTGTPVFTNLGEAPVLPGVPVTGRAWVHPAPGTTGRLNIRFFTAGGTQMSVITGPTTTNPEGEFLHVTATAPASAAYAVLDAAATIITKPSVTWTAEPRPWAPSAASQNVVVSPLSNSVRRATGVIGEAQITDHDFTVQELTA